MSPASPVGAVKKQSVVGLTVNCADESGLYYYYGRGAWASMRVVLYSTPLVFLFGSHLAHGSAYFIHNQPDPLALFTVSSGHNLSSSITLV